MRIYVIHLPHVLLSVGANLVFALEPRAITRIAPTNRLNAPDYGVDE